MDKILEKLYQFEIYKWENSCPYRGSNICNASLSSMFIDGEITENYCDSDNFDNCPIFLSKILRKGCIKAY
jgi:hypothetical protein